MVLEAWELWPGAAAEHAAKVLVDTIAARLPLTMRYYGVPCAIDYRSSHNRLLGPTLSLAAQEAPEALADWLEKKTKAHQLADSELECVQLDIARLRTGVKVQVYYHKKEETP
jgi:hypothetical protein